jgi:hypothetical protein
MTSSKIDVFDRSKLKVYEKEASGQVLLIAQETEAFSFCNIRSLFSFLFFTTD